MRSTGVCSKTRTPDRTHASRKPQARRAGSSIFEVVGSSAPTSDKIAAFYDLVLFPILAWPVRVMAIIRGG